MITDDVLEPVSEHVKQTFKKKNFWLSFNYSFLCRPMYCNEAMQWAVMAYDEVVVCDILTRIYKCSLL